MMLNKYESYQRSTNNSNMFNPHQQQQQHQAHFTQFITNNTNIGSNNNNSNAGIAAAAASATASITALPMSLGGGVGGGGVPNSLNDLLAATKAERESIHSGQFMVSHFEAEEAQDDLEDDGEVKMLDPEDPSLDKADEANTCRDVQLYVPLPQTVVHHFPRMDQECDESSISMVTSHLEIETSLTKLFKCMNLAYSQKLTSPKWNHFKGVRLRWKDKIRLNNVIWRCWHMQFIQKRRTPVCQFASPLDVDIHSNPQTVVLEGKYWKRHSAVIKAEYRKWRKNYKSKATGCLTYDSKSELDFLEWSPLNDRNLMPDDWTTDTLFSAINGPFPFPDSREIARGAGIADFIQPSLGPLQPNLDDIDISFTDLLNPTRLPPVPEEGTDTEMLKNDDYGLPSLVGGGGGGGSGNVNMAGGVVSNHSLYGTENMMDVASSGSAQVDANMLELNTPLGNIHYDDIEQQFVARQQQQSQHSAQQQNSMLLNEASARLHQGKHFGAIGAGNNSGNRCPNNDSFPSKSVINGRIAKSTQRPFRREPHNYDKAQPTLHQTTIYQQMLAEQQKNQQPQHLNAGVVLQTGVFQVQQQQQVRLQFPTQHQQQQEQNQVQQTAYHPQTFLGNYTDNYQQQQQQQQQLSVKVEPHNAQDVMALLNDNYNNSIGYKPYPQFKKSASTGTFLNVPRLPQQQQQQQMNTAGVYIQDQMQQQQPQLQMQQSLPLGLSSQQLLELTRQQNQTVIGSPQQQQMQHPQQQSVGSLMTPAVTVASWSNPSQTTTVVLPKEIHRSNSLPLNVSLHKLPVDGRQMLHDQFAVPKYHAKGKSRVRSNSMHQHGAASVVAAAGASSSSMSNLLVSQQMQQATSDPMLNSTLAQLLTSNTRLQAAVANKNPQQSNSASPSVLASSVASNSTSSSSTGLYPTPGKAYMPAPQPQHSPKKSTSLPMAPSLHSPPGGAAKMLSFPLAAGTSGSNLSLSPDSPFHDSQDSPQSPTDSMKYLPRENQRRAGHIHAEQKRRYNIKNGFDTLHSLIPQLQQNPNAKLSKAAMLQKGAEHIKLLRQERNVLKDKIEALRMERDALNNSLTHLHSILPANGAPVTRQGTEHVRQLYEIYVRYNTMSDWKFWILGLILEPLLASYTSTVSSASLDELRRTAFLWVDQHCSLIDLRPAVTNKLKYLSMHTDIVSDPPSTLQEEVAKALQNTSGQHPNLHGS